MKFNEELNAKQQSVNSTIKNKLINQTEPTDDYLFLFPQTSLTSDCVTFTENEK